jgi:glycosyltransferase involved in cell wall biosynthesis
VRPDDGSEIDETIAPNPMIPVDEAGVRPAGQRRRNLLWLIDSLNMGGAESLVIPFVRHFPRERYALHVCCLASINDNPVEKEVLDERIPFTNLQARNLRDAAAFRRLLALVRRERIELIHAHLTYASIWASAAARLSSSAAVATLHVAPPAATDGSALRDWLMRRMLDRWAARVIAVSADLRHSYLDRGGIAEKKLVTVHNGIELEPFRRPRGSARRLLSDEFGIPLQSPVAVAVSVLRAGKGIEVLLEAAGSVLRRHPEAFILIVGDGPMAAEWQALSRAVEGGDRIRWAGFRRDVNEILAGCDLFVHPTLADAFPTVLLEAMAAGLPVVASRVGGVPEIVVDGETGRLVPAADARSLSAAINALLADRQRREQMSRTAVAIVSRHFSTQAWIERLSSLYAEVLQNHSSEESK